MKKFLKRLLLLEDGNRKPGQLVHEEDAQNQTEEMQEAESAKQNECEEMQNRQEGNQPSVICGSSDAESAGLPNKSELKVYVRLGSNKECVVIGTKLTKFIASLGFDSVRIVGGMGEKGDRVGIMLSNVKSRFFTKFDANHNPSAIKLYYYRIVEEVRIGCRLPSSGSFTFVVSSMSESFVELEQVANEDGEKEQ